MTYAGFVENGVDWLVEQESSKAHPLLLSTAEALRPVLHRIEAALAPDQILQVNLLQQLKRFVIRKTSLLYRLCPGHRINQVVSQGAHGQVRSLRDIEQAVARRPVQSPAVERPQPSEDTHGGTFATSIGSANEGTASPER
jgi:hypothetical protein